MITPLRSTTKRVLVAGGAGFIGSHLVKYLLTNDHIERVVVVDNFISGSRKNLEDIENDERLCIIEMDITDPAILELENEKFDLVAHLAAVANPIEYEELPLETLLVNSEGSQNLIDLAQSCGCQYIYFSSSEVYGNYNAIPNDSLDEGSQSRIVLNQKRSPYVVGKCFGEEMTISLCRAVGIEHLIVRPFNIYGPNMDLETHYGRVIPNFVIWGLRDEQMRIHGDGTQIRSFCHIDDFLNAFVMLLNKKITGKSINIGYPHPISIMDLARLITELLEKEEKFIHVEKYQFEPFMRVPDVSLIKEETGWVPEKTLKNGLVDVIDWFKEGGLDIYSR